VGLWLVAVLLSALSVAFSGVSVPRASYTLQRKPVRPKRSNPIYYASGGQVFFRFYDAAGAKLGEDECLGDPISARRRTSWGIYKPFTKVDRLELDFAIVDAEAQPRQSRETFAARFQRLVRTV
jgi:hypothetical protein